MSFQLRNPRVVPARAEQVFDRAEVRYLQVHIPVDRPGSMRVQMQPKSSNGELLGETVEVVVEDIDKARTEIPQLEAALQAIDAALESVQAWLDDPKSNPPDTPPR